MKRTREDAERTRQAIMDKALEVFYQRGVTRASLNEVAQAAGVTRGAVYYHFKDKSDLYIQLYESLTKRYRVRPEDYAANNYASLDEFKRDIARLFKSFEEDLQFRMFLQILYSRMEYIEELSTIVANEQEKQRAMVKAYERALMNLKSKYKISSKVNCKKYASILYSLVDGIFDSWGIDDSFFESSEMVYAMLDEIFLHLEP